MYLSISSGSSFLSCVRYHEDGQRLMVGSGSMELLLPWNRSWMIGMC